MDTELLKTFLEVSRTRHFGRAAEALYLTQSAVSFRIRQLENQLGVNLFTRHRNNIRLTAAGERLLPYAENLMNTWLIARKEVAQTSQHNEFSIGASSVLWECMLGDWLAQLYSENSDMYFEARIAQRQSLVKQLHERQLDLLITTEAPKMDEFSSQMLGQFELALYCTPPARERKDLSYLSLDWGPDFQQHEGILHEGDNSPCLLTSSALLTRRMLEPLNGCAWLPCDWAKDKEGLVRISDSPSVMRPLYAIWLQNSDKQIQVKALLKTAAIL
ncbi:HTH-type transcriptional regulator HdfR [Salmonella enterica subsp. enterica serovar Choleraesuis]|nr:HTH-type transcriptional regulator HdfR [Salmonella enterica subsp. enterica serovar Choleraesuis]